MEIPKTKRKNGFDYTYLTETENFVLYVQKTKDGMIAGHEIMKKILNRAWIDKKTGKNYPASFRFAADEDFGITAWSVGRDYDYALKRLGEIEEKYVKNQKVLA